MNYKVNYDKKPNLGKLQITFCPLCNTYIFSPKPTFSLCVIRQENGKAKAKNHSQEDTNTSLKDQKKEGYVV